MTNFPEEQDTIHFLGGKEGKDETTIPKRFAIAAVFGSVCSRNNSNTVHNMGNISGTVIDSNNGSPIPAANVSTDPPTSSVTTDVQGNYTIPDVHPGNYTVSASKSGYTTAVSWDHPLDRCQYLSRLGRSTCPKNGMPHIRAIALPHIYPC